MSERGQTGSPAVPRHARAARWIAACVEVAFWAGSGLGIWLLSLSSVSDEELAVGAGCAVLCGVVAVAIRKTIMGRWSAASGVLRPALSLPVSILTDAVAVLVSPWLRRRSARFVTVDIGAEGTSARAIAKRALATALVSASPATVVIDADPESGTLTVHTVGGVPPRIEDRLADR